MNLGFAIRRYAGSLPASSVILTRRLAARVPAKATSRYARISSSVHCLARHLMATSIIIHITVGTEKRTEYFSDEHIRVGSDDTCDLQIHTPGLAASGRWFDLENSEGVYRVV